VGDQSGGDESLLGRVFDGYQNMMQIARCIREAAAQVGSPGPRVLELARRPSGLADYVPEARLERFLTHDSDQSSLTVPLNLPFPDKSFDVSLVSDAYEHIPDAQRSELLREMLRVTNGIVLVGAPNGDEIVSRFDRIVFDFIWGKYAERFEPLRQHIEYGLEPVDQTIASLKALGADNAVALPCNYVYRWIHQILIYFDLQHRQPHWDLYLKINRIYNERMSPYDYREPCYRYLIVVATDSRLDVDRLVRNIATSSDVPASVAETGQLLIDAFHAAESNASDRLRACEHETGALREQNSALTERVAAAQREIERLVGDVERMSEEAARLRSQPRLLRFLGSLFSRNRT
jgi:hypothetical protein